MQHRASAQRQVLVDRRLDQRMREPAEHCSRSVALDDHQTGSTRFVHGRERIVGVCQRGSQRDRPAEPQYRPCSHELAPLRHTLRGARAPPR